MDIMSKRVNVGGTYMNIREKSTSAGKRGTFIGKWSPKTNSSSAQYQAGKRGAKKAIKQYGNTLQWLGGGDKK